MAQFTKYPSDENSSPALGGNATNSGLSLVKSFRTICGGISRPRVAVRDVETAFFSLSVFET